VKYPPFFNQVIRVPNYDLAQLNEKDKEKEKEKEVGIWFRIFQGINMKLPSER